MDKLAVVLTPLEGPMFGPPPRAQLESDRTFNLSVPPGRWKLRIQGAPGYIKSVTLSDQVVSPDNLETGAAPADLRIVIGTKTAQIDAFLPSSTGSASAMFWGLSPGSDFQQGFASGQTHLTLSVPPGRYAACAVEIAQPWMLLQDRPLRKTLESQCATVEVAEGGSASVQLPLISSDDLKRLQESLDN